MHWLLVKIANFQAALNRALEKLPFWPDMVRIAKLICAPVVKLSSAVLTAVPSLRKLEWLLEIEMLQRRHPVMLAISLICVFWRGLCITSLGHIGTDPIIYPLIGAVSGFNPFLGMLCGVAYGLGDLIQKFLKPDMYGAKGWGDLNYWGAMVGYTVSYSSLVIMGVLPGMLARVFGLGVQKILKKLIFDKAAASADGAEPQAGVTYPLAELIARMAGAYAGGYVVMDMIAPVTELPAFYLRPHPDVSCHDLEVKTHLQGRADIGAKGSALGTIFGITPPGVQPPGDQPPGDQPPGTEPPDETEKLEKIKKMQDEIDYHRKEADYWRNKLNEATDPKVREELTRRILGHEDAASRFNDEITAIKGDGIVHHTTTAMDNLNRQISDQQSKEMQQDLKNKAAEREQGWKNKDKLDSLISDLNTIRDEKQRDRMIEAVKNAAAADDKGIPQGDMDKISKFVKRQIDADEAPRKLASEINRITRDAISEGARETLATATFGVSEKVAGAWINDQGATGMAKGAVEGVVDVITFGGYSGFEKGGVTGAVKAIATNVLPIDEAVVIKDFAKGCITGKGDVTWDQAAGAFGSGIIKVLTLGKIREGIREKLGPTEPGLGEPPGGGSPPKKPTFGETRKKAYEEKKFEEREQRERAKKYKEQQEAEQKAREEAQERAERKAQEKAERKAQEKAEREAREKAEREAQKKAEREAQERAEREAQEKAEREARDKAEHEKQETGQSKKPGKSAQEACDDIFSGKDETPVSKNDIVTQPEAQIKSYKETHDYYEKNPTEKSENYHISMSNEKTQAIQSGKGCQAGESGAVYSTNKGQGAAGYTYEGGTNVARIHASNVVECEIKGNTFVDKSGKPIIPETLKGKVVATPGSGAEKCLTYVNESGAVQSTIPSHVFEVWKDGAWQKPG
ncbi:MAG: hypothetical protein RDV48_22090 [Candidatus Eremiobacteraeota bacterium]|nr:hypothetical protein [Candidatus Eremiobacteraeota bacterium]